MNVMMPGFVLGTLVFVGWSAYYFMYMPKWVKEWVERENWRIFILDIMISVLGTIGINQASDSLTAAFAGATISVWGTIMAFIIMGKRKAKAVYRRCIG